MESKKPSTEKENPGLSGQDAHFEPFHVHGPGCNHGHHHHHSHDPYVRSAPKTGRNDPCPCGSGKKFKKCCGGVQP